MRREFSVLAEGRSHERGHYKDLTETGNRARKVSGTQGNGTPCKQCKHDWMAKVVFLIVCLPKVDHVIKSCKEPVSLVNLINIHTLLFKYKFISRAPSIGIQCS